MLKVLYFELKFFAGPLPKRFANLSEQELNQLVEQGPSALDTWRTAKNQQTDTNLSRLVINT